MAVACPWVTALHDSFNTSNLHCVSRACPVIGSASLHQACSPLLLLPRTYQFSTFSRINRNVPSWFHYPLQRSHICGAAMFRSAPTVCSSPPNQLEVRCSNCASLWLCLSGHQLRRSRNRNVTRRPGCIGYSEAGVVAVKPFLDQVLLLGTVLGVYIAGVTSLPRLPQPFPDKRSISARQDSISSKSVEERKLCESQNHTSQNDQLASEDSWTQLQSKLSQAVSKYAAELEEEEEDIIKNPVLGLQAIASIPRLHLLLTSLRHLRKEVEAISDADQYKEPIQWQELSLIVISCVVEPVCKDWLSLGRNGQLGDMLGKGHTLARLVSSLITNERDVSTGMASYNHVDSKRGREASNAMELTVVDSMLEIFRNSESISTYISRSGKAGLYADLIFFLRFGSARRGCDHRVFRTNIGNILEDLVISVGEVVATLFLDGSSLASLSPHGEIWHTFLAPSLLSSRSLERFRNEVALYGWLNHNFVSVAAMFEDRFELWTMQRRSIRRPGKKHKRASTKKPVKTMMTADLVLTCTKLPARRSRELKALEGWRYYYSLFLELFDVVGPLLTIVVSKLGDALYFLLTILIGRSLGLVYQGIRQSVRWPLKEKIDRS